MSQRCLVAKKENVNLDNDSFYDCIYTEDSNWENLLIEWCDYDYETGYYFGPWKLTIRDKELMPKFEEDLKEVGKLLPKLKSLDDLAAIYKEDE